MTSTSSTHSNLFSRSTQSDPSDIRAICTGSNATEIVDYICKHCGDEVKTALGNFEEGCLGSGMDICTFSSLPRPEHRVLADEM